MAAAFPAHTPRPSYRVIRRRRLLRVWRRPAEGGLRGLQRLVVDVDGALHGAQRRS